MKQKVLYLLLFMAVLTTPAICQNGLIDTYYPNGQVESEVFYVKDAIDGTARWYYENGVLKEEKTFMLGKLNGWVKTYYENSAPKEEYYVNDGRLDGLYKTYYDNGGLRSVTTFENGMKKGTQTYEFDKTLLPPKVETAQVIAEDSTQTAAVNPPLQKDSVVQTADQKITEAPKDELKMDDKPEEYITSFDLKPEPIGGFAAIMDKVKYPLPAKQAKAEGEVVVRTFINETGLVTGTQVVKGLGFGCDEVAKKAIQDTPFRPGKQNGKSVKVQMEIPIKFTLSGNRS